MEIIISHHQGEYDFLAATGYKKHIYTTSPDELLITDNNTSIKKLTINKGNEAYKYIKFILDNYETISNTNYYLFIHDHACSYHQDLHINEIIYKLEINKAKYLNVNKRDYYNVLNSTTSHVEPFSWVTQNYLDFFDETVLPIPEQLQFYCCAQFLVSGELIKKRSYSFWDKICKGIEKSEIENYKLGRIFEYMWHYIFTDMIIEPKYEL